MDTPVKKSFAHPDETRPIKKGKVEVVHLRPDLPVMKVTFEPGWTWSECVKPVAGTESCQVPHLNYVLSGRIRIKFDDGTELEFGPDEVAYLPPGHDAEVLGNEPFVSIDYQGAAIYAKAAP